MNTDMTFGSRILTSGHTPATIGPWSPTWFLAAYGSGCHHCPQWWYDPGTLTWTMILGVCWALPCFLVTGASEISIDISPWHDDMALNGSSGPDVTISLSSSAGHSEMDASWCSDTNPNSGDWFDPGLLRDAWWQRSHLCQSRSGPLQGHGTQTWPSAAVCAQMTP